MLESIQDEGPGHAIKRFFDICLCLLTVSHGYLHTVAPGLRFCSCKTEQAQTARVPSYAWEATSCLRSGTRHGDIQHGTFSGCRRGTRVCLPKLGNIGKTHPGLFPRHQLAVAVQLPLPCALGHLRAAP